MNSEQPFAAANITVPATPNPRNWRRGNARQAHTGNWRSDTDMTTDGS